MTRRFVFILFLAGTVARADHSALKQPKNELLACTAVIITVGVADDDIVGRDNQSWSLFIDAATNGTIIRGNRIEDAGSGRQKIGMRIGAKVGEVLLKDDVIKAEKEVADERIE